MGLGKRMRMHINCFLDTCHKICNEKLSKMYFGLHIKIFSPVTDFWFCKGRNVLCQVKRQKAFRCN